MRFAIDVVYVNRDLVVVKVVHGLRPFRVSAARGDARTAIEFPSGTAAGSHTVVGDVLAIDT